MGIKLTSQEMQLVKEGKLSPANIEEHRKLHPIKSVNLNEIDAVKQELKDANIEYKEAIQRNKDLYAEIEQSRKKKEECRNKIAELRFKKKKLLGLIE